MLVLSPHYDDAVLSCGRLIGMHPGCRVLTVFAGVPAQACTLTEWDARCGFASARQAMQARRRENAKALALLGAWPQDLDALDAQYRADTPEPELSRMLQPWLARQARMILAPLGLFHQDHVLLSDAVLQAGPAAGASLLLYEEQPYRRKPGLVEDRLARLRAGGLSLRPYRPPRIASALLKRRAIAAYRSQLGELGLQGPAMQALAEEAYWEVGHGAC